MHVNVGVGGTLRDPLFVAQRPSLCVARTEPIQQYYCNGRAERQVCYGCPKTSTASLHVKLLHSGHGGKVFQNRHSRGRTNTWYKSNRQELLRFLGVFARLCPNKQVSNPDNENRGGGGASKPREAILSVLTGIYQRRKPGHIRILDMTPATRQGGLQPNAESVMERNMRLSPAVLLVLLPCDGNISCAPRQSTVAVCATG